MSPTQTLVFKHKLIHIRQVALECFSGHKCLRHWNCTICKDTMIIPYQDALTKVEMLFEQCDSERRNKSVIQCTTFSTSESLKNFNCAKIKEVLQHQYRYQKPKLAQNKWVHY